MAQTASYVRAFIRNHGNYLNIDNMQASNIESDPKKTIHHPDLLKLSFQTEGLEDLELSTQLLIREARQRGVEVEILDRIDNFIRLERDRQVEFVKQATRTSKDTYIAALVMENKLVTKQLLEASGIRVPNGKVYHSPESAISDYAELKTASRVVKPNRTNFGIGITILPVDFSLSEFESAMSLAFSHDKTILVEEFVTGDEYRILVIGDEVVGILKRVPANVMGDGHLTIEELVRLKNEDPMRGTGYRRPLEKLKLGDVEQHHLAVQGLMTTSIPEKGETVFLRENSNISTGGDSVDYTDEISQNYKDMVVKSAEVVGAVICGVDMIINETDGFPEPENYSIIELNFNPALHIHDFPYIGKNRGVEKKVLDLLGFS